MQEIAKEGILAQKTLHIIVPCYNPDAGWDMVLIDQFYQLEKALADVQLKLTIVNDGSEHGIAEENIARVKQAIPRFNYKSYTVNKGKGFALRYGCQDAAGDSFVYTDIDFPYTTSSMAAMYGGLLSGADVVVGIRETEYYEKLPGRRVIISKLVKQMIKYLLKTSITDTQCGLKGFNNKGRAIFLKTRIDRFLFDMEFVKLASGDKTVSVRPQPVYSREGIVFSHMNYKVLMRESYNFIKLLMPRIKQ